MTDDRGCHGGDGVPRRGAQHQDLTHRFLPLGAIFGHLRPCRASRDRPLLPSKYCWPITICAPLACSYTILPQIRAAKLSGSRQSATTPHCLKCLHHIRFTAAASALTVQWSTICQTFMDLRRRRWSRLQVRQEEPWTTRLLQHKLTSLWTTSRGSVSLSSSIFPHARSLPHPPLRQPSG